jgi:hypothetical protein
MRGMRVCSLRNRTPLDGQTVGWMDGWRGGINKTAPLRLVNMKIVPGFGFCILCHSIAQSAKSG